MLLDHTYHTDITNFQKCTINENTINDYSLEFMLDNTSNGYTLQGVDNANSYIGTITELSQVYLAMYDIPLECFTYTSSENIGITSNQISLNFRITINDEIVMNPRSGGVYLEIYAGTYGVILLQSMADGGQPLATFNSSDQSCEFFEDVDMPILYDRNSIDNLIANIDFSNYYNKA